MIDAAEKEGKITPGKVTRTSAAALCIDFVVSMHGPQSAW